MFCALRAPDTAARDEPPPPLSPVVGHPDKIMAVMVEAKVFAVQEALALQ